MSHPVWIRMETRWRADLERETEDVQHRQRKYRDIMIFRSNGVGPTIPESKQPTQLIHLFNYSLSTCCVPGAVPRSQGFRTEFIMTPAQGGCCGMGRQALWWQGCGSSPLSPPPHLPARPARLAVPSTDLICLSPARIPV